MSDKTGNASNKVAIGWLLLLALAVAVALLSACGEDNAKSFGGDTSIPHDVGSDAGVADATETRLSTSDASPASDAITDANAVDTGVEHEAPLDTLPSALCPYSWLITPSKCTEATLIDGVTGYRKATCVYTTGGAVYPCSMNLGSVGFPDWITCEERCQSP